MRFVLGWSAGLCLLLHCATSWGLGEANPYEKEAALLSTNELPSEAKAATALPLPKEEPENFWQFLNQRTQIGYGAEAEYNDNIFLRDNNRQDDFINTLEGVLFFNDPRGALLYGSQWEVNAFRYMHQARNAINHDVVSYFDFDPGGRYQIHFTHFLDARNSLVFGAPGVDLLRRSTDFQRSVEHRFEPRFRYALNEDDALLAQMSYSIFDDQVQNDASTDRRIFKSSLDWNHSLTRTWSVYAGALYEDRYVPGDKLKSSTSTGARLGGHYDLTRSEAFKALVEVERPKTRNKKPSTDVNYSVSWAHALNPRTDLEITLTDARRTSFISGRTDFRSRAPSFLIGYALTPLVTASLTGSYETQKTSSRNIGSGSPKPNKSWVLGLNLTWQIREQVKINLFYNHRRSTTRDTTNRVLHLQLEGTF